MEGLRRGFLVDLKPNVLFFWMQAWVPCVCWLPVPGRGGEKLDIFLEVYTHLAQCDLVWIGGASCRAFEANPTRFKLT
jgi:hypothetical protein